MGFEQLSSLKPYPAVRTRPSLARLFDFSLFEQTEHPNYLAYFGAAIRDGELSYRPISGAERRCFASVLSDSETPSVGDVYEAGGGFAKHPLRRASA